MKITRPPREPRHGTVTEYMNYGCRCDECRAVAAKRHHNQRKGRKNYEALGRSVPHGAHNAYDNYSCRCSLCRIANTERGWRYSALRRQRDATR